MAVHIRLIRNNIKSSSSYGKYFAKAVSQGEITLDEIGEEICRNSGFSEGTVLGVVTELQDTMKEKLREGQTVVLPGIGRFSLRVESIGVDDPKTFASSVVFFLPAAASKAATFFTTSAMVSKPSGRKDTILKI